MAASSGNDRVRDVIVVGCGAAGLSAALMLGRCRRDVLVCSFGAPRNAAAVALHGYPTRDGISPKEWAQIGRAELTRYATVDVIDAEVRSASRVDDHFVLVLSSGSELRARKLILATGVQDELPEVEGLAALYGKSVFHCPFCDGFEVRDRALAVYAKQVDGTGLALSLLTWSADIILFTDGSRGPSRARVRELERQGIVLEKCPIDRLVGEDGLLRSVNLASGVTVARDALFFASTQRQRSTIAAALGCRAHRAGTLIVNASECSTVRGVYVAGDATRGEQFVVVAAAEGVRAAVALHRELCAEELARSPASR